MLPRHVGNIPLLSKALDASVDYTQAFWTPPLSPRQAYRLEEKQITRRLRLPALVSLSDHDDLRAGSMLRVLPRFDKTPLSVEWTVPFGPTFFHVGVHNLPESEASAVLTKLHSFTARPQLPALKDCLEELDSFPQVLLVLNHPLWDEKQIGLAEHERILSSLLNFAGERLHALEVNGLRHFSENRRVMDLASAMGKPVVSGGDRHGCEPNAILNLTEASIFEDFVDEVRSSARSHVVFMPQYKESVKWRTMQTVVDILREYPGNVEGRRSWIERVYYRQSDGDRLPVSSIWPNGNGPKIFTAVSCAVRIAQWRGVRSAMKTVLSLGPSGEVAA
ncbi:MAG: hypothetical protein ACJ746_30840 [Bryobacteraceae bacterium]